MNKEDDRIAAIFAANLNPLIDAADLDVHSLLDAVWRLNREHTRAEVLAISPKTKSRAYCKTLKTVTESRPVFAILRVQRFIDAPPCRQAV